MRLDLHTHSIKSDDGRAKVENYCKWIQKKQLPLDGFVLTEHRQFDADSDYRELEDEYGLAIMKASEVETDYGHVLVFGVNEDLLAAIDFTDVRLPIEVVLDESRKTGAFAAPCHPGRKRVGLFAHYEDRGVVDGIDTVEVLNGGSIPGEDELSLNMAKTWLPRLWRQRQPCSKSNRILRYRFPKPADTRHGNSGRRPIRRQFQSDIDAARHRQLGDYPRCAAY